MLKKLGYKGQASLEYAMFIIIVVAALISMQIYLKRGIQGRMRTSIEGVGEQYDPMATESDITQTLSGNTITTVVLQNSILGKESIRTDNSRLRETKSGFTRVDSQQ